MTLHTVSKKKDQQTEAFKKAMRTWQNEPWRFISEILGWNPWEKQKEILQSIRENKETYVKSCNAAGKTYLAAAIVLWWIFTRRGKVVTTAPTWRQVKEVLWANIGAMTERATQLGIRAMQTSIKLAADWYAVGLSTRVPDKFQGYHGNVLVVVDEASGVDDPAIWAAIDGNLTDNKHDRLLAIGNPLNPESTFAGKFKLPRKKGLVNHITISAFDVPNVIYKQDIIPHLVSYEWVEQKRIEWGEDSPLYQARILGEFPKIGTAALFPMHWLERAFGYHTQGFYMTEEPSGDQVWVPGMTDLSEGVASLALDVSGSGMDYNAMSYVTGRKLQAMVGWPGVDSSEILGDVDPMSRPDHPNFFDWVELHRPDIGVIDASGLGDPIYRYAQRYIKEHPERYRKFRVKKYLAGSSPFSESKQMRFENRKAEDYFFVRDLLGRNELDLGNVDPQMREKILTQTNAIRWRPSKRGYIQIEDKETMRRREGFSPDEWESLIMAVAGTRIGGNRREHTASFDYKGRGRGEDEDLRGVVSFDYNFDRY